MKATLINNIRKFHSITVTRRFNSGFKKVGVVGLGLMGHGVAQVTAAAGFNVLAIETQEAALNTGMKRIEDSLNKVVARGVKKGKIPETDRYREFDRVYSRIETTTKLEDAHDCDLIIEAIIEQEPIKIDFYKKLGGIANPDCVFASNTSSLPITNMAVASGRPELFVGLHFFNPVQIMKLLEVISTTHTTPEVADRVTKFGKEIGKTTVQCGDTPGFIVNRLLIPFMSQSMAMVDRGDASVTDIDISMQLGTGHPMGPLMLADYVGLDTTYNILTGWKQAHPNDPAFFVPQCLEAMVKRGELGRKTGKGFYVWDGDKVVHPA